MKEITPQKAANQISKILAISFGEKRFPISVKEWAVQYSKDICPNSYNCQNCKNKNCIGLVVYCHGICLITFSFYFIV